MEEIKILELFGGIGACTQAFKRLGIPYKIADYVEIDKYAVKSYNAINGTNFEPQDITKWNKNIEVDFIMHGSPCQDFSVAGKQAGGDEGSGTRSSLMYETLRIVNKLKPKYVLWENVKNLVSKKHKPNFDRYIGIMSEYGYNSYYQVLDAKDYGVPQHRERIFTLSIRKDIDNGNFKFPEKEELKLRLKDILEKDVDEKYYLSDSKIQSISHWKAYQKPFEKVQGQNSVCPTLTARGAGEEHSGMITYSDNLQDTTNLQEKIIQCENLKTKLCNSLIENNIVKGGEIINHSYTNSEQRDTLDKYIETENGISPTLTTRPDILGYVEKKYNNFIEKNGYMPEMFNPYNESEIKDIAPAQSTQCGSTGSSATILKLENNLRIRKLTPKECWRLMGFSDESFEKAQKVNSNAQLYKQAGNSIVVNVLEKIIKNLFT